MSRFIVVGYLFAIVLANLSLAHFGPRAAIYNAFLFIGYDLLARDYLHDVWRGRSLVPKLGALIAAGGVLSYLASLATTADELDVGRIAVASMIAFTLAAVADSLVYHRLRNHQWYERANQSNVVGSLVDSILFLPLAFGGFPWAAIFGLFTAKVAGGVVWSFLLARRAEGRAWSAGQRELYPPARRYRNVKVIS